MSELSAAYPLAVWVRQAFYSRRRRHSTLGYSPADYQNRTLGQPRAGLAA